LPISQNTASISVTTIGNYQLLATPIGLGCPRIFNYTVVPFLKFTASFMIKEDFESNQSIVVEATGGSGQYSYSFNNLPFQNYPIYSPNDGGDILVKVQDSNNCFQISKIVTLWQYPRFFTPNGDNFNDEWGISSQKNIRVDLFDRFGKLVKQLQNGARWDGMLNSQPLPSTDYWFVIYYDENKTFKGHFSLKR
jgi:gliding motility-associated-like protein